MTPETQKLIDTLTVKLTACEQLCFDLIDLKPPLPVVVRVDLAFELLRASKKYLELYNSQK